MSDKIRELRAVAKKPREPDPEVLAKAQKLLDDVKAGTVTGFVAVTDQIDGSVERVDTGCDNVYEMAGVLLFMAIGALGEADEEEAL